MFGKLSEGVLDPIKQLDRSRPALRVRVRISSDHRELAITVRTLADKLQVSAHSSPVRPEMIPGNLEHPRADFGLTAESGEPAPDPKKNLLCRVECFLVISRKTSSQPPHRKLELLVHLVEVH